jgi:hypothetical protein
LKKENNFLEDAVITRPFQVVPKTSKNINPRKERVVFALCASRESASASLVGCFSYFLMLYGTDIYLFLYDLKVVCNNLCTKTKNKNTYAPNILYKEDI